MILVLAILGCKTPEEETCPVESGVVCNFAGTGDAGFDGGDNHRLDSMFYYPQDIEYSPFGDPIISDWNNHKLRLLEDDDTLTTVMGTDFLGDGPPDFSDQEPPGAPGTTVNLNHPTQQAYYPDGILLSASWHTHKMRTWDPDTGLVVVVLGAEPGFEGEDGAAAADSLANQPRSVVIDSAFNAYFVDMRNQRIRLITADQTVYTIAGNGEKDFCGDGGDALEACLNFPENENPEPGGAVALDEDGGLLYIADTESHRIRVVDLNSGIINTIAGTGDAGDAGDGGDALSAQFSSPRDIELDGDLLYIADTENHRIRVMDLTSGAISAVAGTGTSGESGDGGDALDATFNRPFGIEIDMDGRLFISDTFNHRIRVIEP
ncbi:MAG: DNA-binding beta-propeller fold protein YncE [Myxococcota bacterium]|jgi:DNA-binding beta-propeller fold protein YncE